METALSVKVITRITSSSTEPTISHVNSVTMSLSTFLVLSLKLLKIFISKMPESMLHCSATHMDTKSPNKIPCPGNFYVINASNDFHKRVT